MTNIEKALDILSIEQCNSKDFYEALEDTGYDGSVNNVLYVAKTELECFQQMQGMVKAILAHNFAPSDFDTVIFSRMTPQEIYAIAVKDVTAYLVMPMVKEDNDES
jgi:hypothetical protein